MSTICKYCNGAEDKQDRPGLICESCVSFVHISCLKRPGTPGDFTCDVFFDFTCADCSDDNNEVFVRNKFPWVNVILLTLHHLSNHSYAISNHGYFHYKTHICSFIDRSWNVLFGHQIKQKKNWVGTIAGSLSVYNSLLFRSGSAVLGESGWWKLMHWFSPAVASHIIQELAREKPKGRPRNQLALDKLLFIAKTTELGYNHLLFHEEEEVIEPLVKRKRVGGQRLSHGSRKDLENYGETSQSAYDDEDAQENAEAESIEYGYETATSEPLESRSLYPVSTSSTIQNDTTLQSDSIGSFHKVVYDDSDSHSISSNQQTETQLDRPKRPNQGEKPYEKEESLFSSELNSCSLPWREKRVRDKGLVEMSQYAEIQLLKQVDGIIPRVKDPARKAELHRLKAKLALRRLKRHKHLPIFDLDKAVKLLGGYITDDPRVVTNAERVLDRFQRSYLIDNLCGTIASTNYGTLLLPRIEPVAFRSAYSGALLKPFIRKDSGASPLWLRLQEELLTKTNRHDPEYSLPPRATLDYSYVRPQHVAAVNSLCAQFFWPGVDLTEALQYPEFSCVVSYKQLVVGCAFLVPDAGRGEAYISFVLTRPEWRNAHIATFMLYHLLQTCSGKDVTLHVSPTNPAIFLYQKFGFKVEELIQDFYEKYYDIDYKGCRHALLLRLIR